MQFEFPNHSGMYVIKFGRTIRGVTRNNERPLNCYITPQELEKEACYTHYLADYLRTIQHALQPGGRVVIR